MWARCVLSLNTVGLIITGLAGIAALDATPCDRSMQGIERSRVHLTGDIVQGMRREELERIGVQLPVLPAIALGALPGEPDWAARLSSLGLDVVQSGAAIDSAETVAAARAAAPRSVVKARPGPAEELVASGARLLETEGGVPAGAYALWPDSGALVGVEPASSGIEDPNDIASRVIEVAWRRRPAELWVAALPGLELLSRAVVEDKLAALVEGTRQARLAIAKVQFEDDEFFRRPS